MHRVSRRLSIAALLAAAGTCSAQSTWVVPGDFPNLTSALNPITTQVGPGDTIQLVDPLADLGLAPFHTGTFEVAIPGLTIETRPGEDQVVVDGDGQGVVFTVTGVGNGLTLRNLTITGGSAPGDGGGVDIFAGADVTIEDCLLIDNIALDDGGAIKTTDNDLVIRRTRFENNRTTGPETSGDPNGGAIQSIRGTLLIEDCEFINNVSASDSGAIRGAAVISTVIRRSRFEGNVAMSGGGGGAFFDGAGTLIVEDSEFIGNASTVGGAGMRVTNLTRVDIEGSLFLGNETGTDGGGLLVLGSSLDGVVRDTEFRYNVANSDGGGVHTDGPTGVEFDGCRFYGNRAESLGGGFHATGETSGGGFEPDIYNSVFVGNIANNGAATTAIAGPDIDMVNCTVMMNVCRFDAGQGAILNAGGAASTTMTNVIGFMNVPLSHDTNPVFPTAYRFCNFDDWDGFSPASLADPSLGNISADPMFVRLPSDGGDGWGDDPSTPDTDESLNDDFGDLRLTADSPSIDAGDSERLLEGNAARTLSLNPLDNDGEPRVVAVDGFDPFADTGVAVYSQVVDQGAYEFQPAPATMSTIDFDGNGVVNISDLFAFINAFTSN
ncbi:MAG: right-handed parallel beta-helix repeat-containing protein [Planctomycetota bacterium]